MYENWFSGYCSEREHTAQVRGWFQNPAKLTQDRIAWYDKEAQQLIEDAQQLIADLTEYRKALAARYGELETALYTRSLLLIRHPACTWSKTGVKYEITIVRRYEDGTEKTELNEVYEGRARRDAIARYEALTAQYPGINAEKQIEKRAWER